MCNSCHWASCHYAFSCRASTTDFDTVGFDRLVVLPLLTIPAEGFRSLMVCARFLSSTPDYQTSYVVRRKQCEDLLLYLLLSCWSFGHINLRVKYCVDS